MRPLILMLCGAIAFCVMAESSRTNADTAAQQKQKAVQELSDLLDTLSRNDAAILELLQQHSVELQGIEECHAEEIAEVKEKLVAVAAKQEAPAAAAECDCNCDCADKLQALAERVEKLEQAAAKVEAAQAAQPQYPSAGGTGSSSTGGGGSTGSTKSGGSTGSVASYGSQGSTAQSSHAYQAAQPRTPVRNAVRAVVQAPAMLAQGAMTREAMLDLHDSLHEGGGPERPGHWSYPRGSIEEHLARDHGVRFVGPAFSTEAAPPVQVPMMPAPVPVQAAPVPVYSPQPQYADCPDGQCPKQVQGFAVQSQRWFLGKNLGRRR